MFQRLFSEFFRTLLGQLREALEQAILTSHGCAAHDAGQRRYWASVLFTRICNSGISILWLCPGSPVNRDGLVWDFSSIASLTRNLFECSLTFFYIGIEAISDDEWKTRLRVMQIHDCIGRLRMYRAFDPGNPQLSQFEAQADELRTDLLANPYFVSLPEAQRKKLLKGVQAWVLTQDEILQRMGESDQKTRGYYMFLSSHTHSFPVAFFRMTEDNCGRGEECDVDKGYIAEAIEFAARALERATADMQGAFRHLLTFTPGTFNWNVLRRVSRPGNVVRPQQTIEGLGNKWDIKCSEEGCLMFTDVLRGDPDHPADLQNPEFLTIAVAIDRGTKSPTYFAFHVPPNADRKQGLLVSFSRTVMVADGNWQIKLDEEPPISLEFESCDEESCVARVRGGAPESDELKADLLAKFLDRSHILFLYVANGQQLRTIAALSPFRDAYQRLCNTEFK